MPSNIRNYRSNVPVKYLSASGGIASNTLQFNIDNADLLPPVPFTMVIEPGVAGKEEIITVTDVNGVQLTVVRGDEGNAPTSHLDGVELRHMVTGRDLQNSRDHIDEAEGVHDLNSALSNNKVVGTKEVQTLEGKTLTAPLINGGTVTGVTLSGTINASSATITSYATESYVTSAVTTGVSGALPVGSMIMWAGSVAPTNWLLCNGNAIPSQYTSLISLIGANTPNMGGRVPVGINSDADFNSMFKTGGNKATQAHTHDLSSHTHGDDHVHGVYGVGNHSHGLIMAWSTASHDHAQSGISNPLPAMQADGSGSNTIGNYNGTAVAGDGGHAHSLNFKSEAGYGASTGGPSNNSSGSFGTGVAAAETNGNLQPYLAVNFIIKAA